MRHRRVPSEGYADRTNRAPEAVTVCGAALWPAVGLSGFAAILSPGPHPARQGALTTCPDLMQLVQTTMRLVRPALRARTDCRLGLKRRLLTLWAWLTWLPTIGFLPQISHFLAILTISFTDTR